MKTYKITALNGRECTLDELWQIRLDFMKTNRPADISGLSFDDVKNIERILIDEGLVMAGGSPAIETKTPVHYTATGQAINMLDKMTDGQYQEWNDREMAKIQRMESFKNREPGDDSENCDGEWDD